jgi:hypothetical protein
MDNPKPDNIQSEPPKHPPAEIRAHPPTPRKDEPPVLPNYDFKKRQSRWRLMTTILFFVTLSSCVIFYFNFMGAVSNKTFSNVVYEFPRVYKNGTIFMGTLPTYKEDDQVQDAKHLWLTVESDLNDGKGLLGKTIKIRGKVLECKERTIMLPSDSFDGRGGFSVILISPSKRWKAQ